MSSLPKRFAPPGNKAEGPPSKFLIAKRIFKISAIIGLAGFAYFSIWPEFRRSQRRQWEQDLDELIKKQRLKKD